MHKRRHGGRVGYPSSGGHGSGGMCLHNASCVSFAVWSEDASTDTKSQSQLPSELQQQHRQLREELQ